MNVSRFSLTQEAPDLLPGDFYGSFLRVIVVLALIVSLIVLVIRFLAVKNKQWTGNRALQVHAGIALGQHKSLQIVEIGGTLYIVGVGDSISLIDKIDDEERAAALLSALTAKPAPGFGSASELLGKWLGGRRKADSAIDTKSTDTNEAFRALLQEKLKNLGNRKDTLKAWMEEEPKREGSDDR